MVGKFIFNAPAGIIILINRHAYKESDIGYTPYLDCGVAAQNMVLTAYSLGLGSCLVNLGKKELGEKNENVVRQHFNISDDWILAMYIAIGYSDHNPLPPGRKKLDSVLFRQ